MAKKRKIRRRRRMALLQTRQSTHGDFNENARISQALKEVIRQSSGYGQLNDTHREALEMIFLKISRITSGQSSRKEHWEDIVGYGKLGEEVCVN